MILSRTLAAAAAVALLAGAAHAQTDAAAPVAEPAPAAAVAAPAPAPAPAPAFTPIVAKGDIVDTLKASGEFTVFTKALDSTNMTGLIKGNKGLTVFAPTDAAFAALPAGELDRLMKPENATELQSLVAYHIVNATVDSKKISGSKGPVATVARSEVLLDGSFPLLRVNSAPIMQADVRATNGVVHVLAAVLSPTDPAIAAAKAEAAAAAAEATTTPAG